MQSVRFLPPLSTLMTAVLPHLCGAAATAQSPAAALAIAPLADTTFARIRAEVTVPEGFELSVFAAPPELTYPTCLVPAGNGVVYVCTDPNLLFGRERHLGRVLRFVDGDGDGVAESYTVFADSLDAVRGIAYDGESVYLMHAPTLAAYRDTDGDGVADEERILVEGLGFGLEDRNGDHTANGLRLGIDGWIYVAVGDYGFLAATGTDGTQIGLHSGGVVRLRPDGSELEIVARGTRNIYDVALDPQLRIFARDNTNNGQAWNSRFHYLPTGGDAGYPSLFRNFPDEALAPLADLGAGAATTTVWADHPALPPGVRDRLLSADWALNRVYAHRLTPRGATFELSQEELMEVPRPVDIELDPSGSLFIASLSGGSYDYAGEHVGYVLRLRPEGAPSRSPEADDRDPLATLLSGSAVARVAAQQEILRVGSSPPVVAGLERAIADTSLPLAGRTAALFTLKQLRGVEAQPALVRAAGDPALRAMALRALADRRGETAAVPTGLLEAALTDNDPGVRLEAVTALARVGGPQVAPALMRAAASAEPTVAHVARNAFVALGASAAPAALAALDHGGQAERTAGLHVLSRMHSPLVVRALQERAETAEGAARRELLGALARLHHREGFWAGEWWGNQPSTEGPYFRPVRWEESARIRAVLVDAVEASAGEELGLLLEKLEREGVLPREGAALVLLSGEFAPAERRRLIEALVGGREIGSGAISVLSTAAETSPATREAVTRILAALTPPPGAAVDPLAEAAADTALPVDLRTRALMALLRLPRDGSPAVLRAYAVVIPELPAHPPLLQSWRRFVNDRARPEQLKRFADLASTTTGADRVLAYAILIQTAALPRNPEPTRARAAELIRAAERDASAAEALAEARSLLGAPQVP